jgi:basic membrane protein A and related proteins
LAKSIRIFAAIGGGIALVAIVLAIFAAQGLQLQGSTEPKSSLRVAVVTDALFSDHGWGESSLKAAELVEEQYGFEVATEDNVGIADIEQTLARYAQADYDLIIAHGFQWGDPAVRVGKQYPDVKIVVFTGLVSSENVASIFPQQQQGSFLLGALAAMLTKTGTIGFVGGEEYPNIINIFEGYRQGARHANPDVQIIGTYLNDWDNPAKGKEAAASLIRQQNVDVVFHVADSSGHGVIEAAKENGIFALGAVQDQNALAPDAVVSSFVLDVDKAYAQAVNMTLAGGFKGEIFRPGIEAEKGAEGEGMVYLASFHGLEGRVPASAKSALEELTQDLLAGNLAVPERLETTATTTSSSPGT